MLFVGASSHSVAFDVIRKKIIHKGEVLTSYPKRISHVPQQVFMFVDMDAEVWFTVCSLVYEGVRSFSTIDLLNGINLFLFIHA